MKRARATQNKPALIAVAAGLAALLCAGAAFLLLISPRRAEVAELTKKIDETQQTIDSFRARSHGPANPLRVAELFRISKAIPDSEDMPGVLLQLSRVASDAGITIRSISPQAVVAGTGSYKVPIEVVADGSFYDLSDFLYRVRTLVAVSDGRLTTSGRLFTVDEMRLEEGLERFPQLQATMIVSAYVYGDAPAVAGAAPPPATTETTATPTSTDQTATTPEPAPASESDEAPTAVGAP